MHNHNDIASFKKILDLKELDEMSGDDNITQAYSYFKKHIVAEKFNIDHILARVLFVGIDLDVQEDEQQIFDTINSLGVRLTTAELLKNYFFNRDEIEIYNEYWKELFERDDDTKNYWDRVITTGRLRRTFIDLFFYSYLQIKIQDPLLKVKTEEKVEFSKVETLFDSYKTFIKDYQLDRKEMLNEIKEYALLFRKNFDYDIVNRELTNDYGIERINSIIFGLETTTLIPYALYVLKNVEESERNNLFEFLEAYLMRRMVAHATTKGYNQLFTTLISNEITSKNSLIEFIERKSDKTNFLPDDTALKQGFDFYYLTNKQSAGIIYLLESKIRNRGRQSTQLLGMSKYSLEHLMPKKWENNWGKLASKEERDNRNRKLLTLGNLAIITQSLNASIRDSNWKTKKKGKAGKDGLIHYSAGIETLAPYIELEEWNEDEIGKRANDLYKMALETWKYESVPVQEVGLI